MIPSLQRFYGGRPHDWLRIPKWLLAVYAKQLPVLQARESLHRLQLLAISQGALEKHTAEDFIQNLTETAYPNRLEKQRANVAQRPTSTDHMQALVGSYSVNVVKEAT